MSMYDYLIRTMSQRTEQLLFGALRVQVYIYYTPLNDIKIERPMFDLLDMQFL